MTTQLFPLGLLLSRYHYVSLVWIFIRALLLVDPDSAVSPLEDTFDVLHYLGLFVWREYGNVTLTLSAIRNNLLASKKMICPLFFLLRMEQGDILRCRERLPPETEAKLGRPFLMSLDEVTNLCNPTCTVPSILSERSIQRK